jgi:mRNA-degrading endonuclease RelE of RelBE toxin-antitoxin system
MSYKVIAIPQFKRDFKKLSKKYPSLKNEYTELIETLEQDPTTGTPIGNHCYKIRLAVASKGKGKSGGARVITCVRVVQSSVYLLSIYDKSDQETISDHDLFDLIKFIP